MIYPTISSPGIGLQHFDSLIRTFSNPSTYTPLSVIISSLIGTDFVTSWASFKAFCLSNIRCFSVSLLTICTEVTPPNPTAANKSSSFAK